MNYLLNHIAPQKNIAIAARGSRLQRVVISATFDPDFPGGGSKYSTDLVRVWLKNGYNVHVLCSNHKRNIMEYEAHQSDGKLVIHAISNYNEIMFSHTYRQDVYDAAWRIIHDIQPETIHIHNFPGMLGAVWAAVNSNFPTIYTALDFGLICIGWYLYNGTETPCIGPKTGKCRECLKANNHMPQYTRLFTKLHPFVTSVVVRLAGKAPSFYRQYAYLSDYYDRALEHLEKMVPLLARFDAIVTISKITGQVFLGYGVSKERIHYAVQGVDINESKESVEARSCDEVILVYLGHFAPIKGFHVVVKALEQLPNGLRLKVKLFGSSAKLFVKFCSLSARRYLQVDRLLIGDEVEAELKLSDGLIIPSLWHENTPYAVLRALSVGRPVIGSDHAGISHLITEAENGLLIPPGNIGAWTEKLKMIAMKPDILRKMRTNCFYRKTVREHAKEIEQIIKEVIA